MTEDNQKTYLGDGVYAMQDCACQIKLYTSNGIDVTNEIYLEREVFESLLRFAAKIWEK